MLCPQGGTLIFSSYLGSGPASTVHPKKNIRNFKHPKKYLKFWQPSKNPQFCTLTLRKDPKMHRNDHLLEYSPSNGTMFFGNNIKSKMGILNLIRKIYFNQKTLTKNIFWNFVYVFINAGIGWNFNILNVLCQITFPSCTLSDMDQWLSVEYKTMYILI